jgi:hypothetical protein
MQSTDSPILSDYIQAAIARIKEVTANDGSIEEMSRLAQSLHVRKFTSPRYKEGSLFYRARVMSGGKPPQNISEISTPPRLLSKSYQRCNRPGRPVFYCSDHPSAPLVEIHAAVGDYVVLSRWMTKRPLLVGPIGYTKSNLERLGARRECPEFIVPRPQDSEDYSHNESITAYLAELFTQQVPNSEEYRYKPSIAIAESFFNYRYTQLDYRFEGIIYPTLALRASCENLALTEEFASTGLMLTAADFVQVIDRNEQDVFLFKYFGSVKHVLLGGILCWDALPLEKTMSHSFGFPTHQTQIGLEKLIKG